MILAPKASDSKVVIVVYEKEVTVMEIFRKVANSHAVVTLFKASG